MQGLSFIRSSLIYLFGSGINGVLPLLFLPILTRYLTPTDYGIVATSLVLVNMLTLFVGFNTSGLIAQSHFAGDSNSHQRLVSTNINTAGVITAILLILLTILKYPISEAIKFPPMWVPLMAIIALFSVIQSIYFVILQIREEPKKFVVLQLLFTGLNFAIAIILIVGMGFDWRGRMLATIISGIIITVICIYSLNHQLGLFRLAFYKSSFRKLLSFGIPLVPHFIGGWVMT
ncbi:uncharacterized protein METZ01_LOCUS349997, partial [marine metagenome]